MRKKKYGICRDSNVQPCASRRLMGILPRMNDAPSPVDAKPSKYLRARLTPEAHARFKWVAEVKGSSIEAETRDAVEQRIAEFEEMLARAA